MTRKLVAVPEPVHQPVAGRPVKLGKREVKRDKRNLRFARYLPRADKLPRVPGHLRRSEAVAAWPMYGNDSLGDCTCAAVGHIEQLVSSCAGAPETPTDQAVLDLYWATGSADDGRYCLDVLNRWTGAGFGPDQEKALAFVQIDPRRHDHLKLAMYLFGNVYVGLALPVSAQRQRVWTVGRGAAAAPGSWGGHCVPYFDFTRSRLTCVTWGQPLELSWGFHGRYCDEAYTILSPDWIRSGLSPADAGGFNFDRLDEDLAAIRATA